MINNNGHDYVDLDLPSGTLWATCNVGADKPSEPGLYFQWGDTVGYKEDQIGNGKKEFTWKDYKWNPNGDGKTFTKYTSPGDKLELEDDAANVNMGGSWHIPTPAQIQELIDNTTSYWETSDNGVRGLKFTSKKDSSKYIFIPASGYAWSGLVCCRGGEADVWSSMLRTSYVSRGQYLYFEYFSGIVNLGNYYRDCGCSVRGVLDINNMNENLDLTKILKNAPKGTKLWSPICGECELVEIDEDYPKTIICNKPGDSCFWKFKSNGHYASADYDDSECVLFPSKENHDWSTFKVSKEHKHFEAFEKVLVGLIMNGKQIWTRDVYMCYRKDVEEHQTVFESMVPDELIIPYDADKDGKPVKEKVSRNNKLTDSLKKKDTKN